MSTPKLQLHAAFQGRALADILKEGGVAGAGGAGFPTYVKYAKPLPYHLTNAQESEPGYFIDKWIHYTYPQEFTELYHYLLEWGCGKIIIAPKYKDREWFIPLEKATGAKICDCRGKQPINPDEHEEPILITYTDDMYAFGKEQALIRTTTGVKLAQRDLPGNFGFIVNNTETLLNMYRLLTTGEPVTRKFVHIYGETPHHLFTEAPLGTTAADLFREAGTSIEEIQEKGHIIIDGGPGWYSIVEDPYNYSLTKRMNALIVCDPEYADPRARNDVRTVGQRQGYPRIPLEQQEKKPRGFMEPDTVQVRLIDNPDFAIVKKAVPIVSVGDKVKTGQVIARAADDEGFSIPAHASIDGTVTAVTDEYIEIKR